MTAHDFLLISVGGLLCCPIGHLITQSPRITLNIAGGWSIVAFASLIGMALGH